MADRVEWGDGGPGFGAAWPYGSCNALCDGIVCGWPRRANGTCPAGHPAQPSSFTCPACGAVSYHPKDLEQGYCGRCHAWTGERS